MNQLEDALRSALHADAATAPTLPPSWDETMLISATSPRRSHVRPERWLAAAAASTVAVVGLWVVADRGNGSPASAPNVSTPSSTAVDAAPFANSSLTGLIGATKSAPMVAIDDGDLAVTGYYDDQGRVCVTAHIAGIGGSGCFPAPRITAGDLTALSTDPDPSGRVLVAGIVPDTVATVADGDDLIQPINNLWFAVVDRTPHSFVLASADGSRTQTLTVYEDTAGGNTDDSVPAAEPTSSG